MNTCPSCRAEGPAGQRFCGSCGAPIAVDASSRPLEERKVVTALFCDLVGFTATSESADPEDIDRMLTAYFAMVRGQVEAHGGVVEKFIGDAVLGVFGVPTAHEDDAERAVRAALRITDEAGSLHGIGDAPVRLRVGINTGEALVRLGVSPGSGERFLAGDAINTASRIQSAAPEMGVAVGLRTFEATRATFDYHELPPASLKGKAQPVRVFHARAPRARLGVELARTHATPYVGRAIDLALLEGLCDKTVAAGSVQLVTIVGEPGIGKSRIVSQLRAHALGGSEPATWREGRCLPYGDGISFWALGELVKAHAGISDSDGPDVVIDKLEAVLPDDAERSWLRQRLLPLLGIGASTGVDREEQFTAWRRFLEHLAEDRPAVLVFEDLHWADDALLAFIEHVADRAEGVPLLIVGTARPELYERYPAFASRLHNANRINLGPLPADEVERLVTTLLEGAGLSAELAHPILDRAEGNPLYAGELVRLLRDREEGPDGAGSTGDDVPFPDSVQALIAARLDTLAPERKSLLADAAVVGKVFWAGAVAAMGDRDVAEVTDALRELARKELVQPVRRSSIVGEAEYGFSHILTRDVAYSQLPRAARAARHAAAARWIEACAPERLEDLSDVLAFHYETALASARAAGAATEADELVTPTLRFLTLAGKRALGLDTPAAVATLERALALAPPGDARRIRTLTPYGQAMHQAGRPAEATVALEEVIVSTRATGDVVAAAEAMILLSRVVSRSDQERAAALGSDALALVEPLGPSPELVAALSDVAAIKAISGESEAGLAFAERALTLAAALSLPRPARPLGFRGMARLGLGDAEGQEDLREAIVIAMAAGEGREVALLHLNLGFQLLSFEGPPASIAVLRDGRAYADARGIVEIEEFIGAVMISVLVDTGEHGEALALAERLAPRHEAAGDIYNYLEIRRCQARIAALRGRIEPTTPWLDHLVAAAKGEDDPMLVGACATAVILVRSAVGDDKAARALLVDLEPMLTTKDNFYYPTFLPAMVRVALHLGEVPLAERLTDWQAAGFTAYEANSVAAARAALAEARGDVEAAVDAYANAAERWERFGVVPEQAFALLGQGRCLLALGRSGDTPAVLERARRIFEGLAAGPALAETEALIGRASGNADRLTRHAALTKQRPVEGSARSSRCSEDASTSALP